MEEGANFCSNNYLGLANTQNGGSSHKCLEKIWCRTGAVRSIAGTMEIHTELERRLAAFKGVEAAIVLQSGFSANTAVIPVLVGKEDVIISDELNHASIIDGSRLSGARIERYAHANTTDLEDVLKKNQGTYRRALVITDGVFSMDGDLAPLDQIYGVTTVRCDVNGGCAHGEGVIGRGGRGIVDHFGLHGKVDVEVGTLSRLLAW